MTAGFDAGAGAQSAAWGGMSLPARLRPGFAGMPAQGLLRCIRQPIHVVFARRLRRGPGRTPGQLAPGQAAWCLLAPWLTERRTAARHGAESARFRAAVARVLARLKPAGDTPHAQ